MDARALPSLWRWEVRAGFTQHLCSSAMYGAEGGIGTREGGAGPLKKTLCCCGATEGVSKPSRAKATFRAGWIDGRPLSDASDASAVPWLEAMEPVREVESWCTASPYPRFSEAWVERTSGSRSTPKGNSCGGDSDRTPSWSVWVEAGTPASSAGGRRPVSRAFNDSMSAAILSTLAAKSSGHRRLASVAGRKATPWRLPGFTAVSTDAS